MILNGDFFDSNGRNEIWNYFANKIKEEPFRIRGINADQLEKTGFYENSNYAHNIFLELFYQFGVVIGGIFSLVIIKNVFDSLSYDNEKNSIKTIFMCVFFPISIFSGSLWTSLYCWLWLFIKKKGKKKNE